MHDPVKTKDTATPLNDLILFVVVCVAVRGLYVFLFPKCYSYDLNSWNVVADLLMAGKNPYHETGMLNWPPFWMQLLFVFKKISLFTHVPFNEVLRGFLVLSEIFLGLVLYAALVRFAKARRAARIVLVGIALNPICIYQVCQHCNFDVLVGFWILLAVYLLLRFQEESDAALWLGACFAVGLGAATKTVPLCLAPLLLISLRRLKLLERCLGAALMVVPITLSLSVLYVLEPGDIQSKVLGYRSLAGTFGLTGLFSLFGWDALLRCWSAVFLAAYGCAWVGLGWWLSRRERVAPAALVSLAVLLLLAIPSLGPGYAPQYVYWFLPLLVLLYGLAEGWTRRLLWLLYGVGLATYTIAYGFNFKTYGAFVLEIVQNQPLLEFGKRIATPTGERLLNLPLWVSYVATCAWLAALVAKGARPLTPDARCRAAPR